MKTVENDSEGFACSKRGGSRFLNAQSFYPLLPKVVGSSLGNCERTVSNCASPVYMITFAGGLPGCFTDLIGLTWVKKGT
jgi:hypothetical protein